MRKRAFTLIELLVVIAIIAILAAILFPVFAQAKLSAKRSASLSNIKQIQLSALMYSADNDDNIVIMVSGTWSNLASPIGNDNNNPLRTKTWVELCQPYIKNYGLLADPVRGDATGIFGGPPSDTDGNNIFNTAPRTLRNQGRLAMYAFNYIFLSPWGLCVNSESRSYTQAEDAGATVQHTASQFFYVVENTGYFMVNAPAMWPIIAPHTYYCVLYTIGGGADVDGTGQGNWSRLNNVTDAYFQKPHEAQAFTDTGDGVVSSFTDGHAKYLKAAASAAGTDYMTSSWDTGGFMQGGAMVTNREVYVWNLDANFFCETFTEPGC